MRAKNLRFMAVVVLMLGLAFALPCRDAFARPAAVMPQPAPAQPQIQDVPAINIPNSRGGYTAVTLKKAGTGYVGPQGEYYSDNPTVEQLKVLYGR